MTSNGGVNREICVKSSDNKLNACSHSNKCRIEVVRHSSLIFPGKSMDRRAQIIKVFSCKILPYAGLAKT